MSGRKQHILPQFVQNHFTVDGKIYVYKKDHDYPHTVKDNFCQRDYYSSPENPNLDNEITEKEKFLSLLWDSLLKMPLNYPKILSNDIQDLIGHMFFRNKFIIESLFNQLKENISIVNTKENMIEDALSIYSKNQQAFIRKNISYQKYAEKVKGLDYDTLLMENQKAFEEIKKIISKKIHWLSVPNMNAPSINIFSSGKYQYEIIQSEERIVLSDTLLLFKNTDEYSFMPDNFTDFLMPLSSNRFIYIYETTKNIPNIKIINNALIENSYESFITGKKYEHLLIEKSNIQKNELFFYLKKSEEELRKESFQSLEDAIKSYLV